jgi:restriction endonuclease S subunit
MKLDDIARIRAGHAFRKKLINDPSQKFLVIQMKDLDFNGDIHWDSMVRTEPAAASQELVAKDDLLLVSRGANNTAYFIGENPPEQSLAAPYFFHITLRSKFSQIIDPGFLAWQLNQKPIQDYFRKNSEGSTSKAIRREIVENVEVFTPPMSKQTSIVSLHKNLSQQKRQQEQLIANSKTLMNKIACDLLRPDHLT